MKAVIDMAITIITEQLAAGETVTLQGFGTFEVRERASTIARNPRTGERVSVPCKACPCLRSSESAERSCR